MLVLRSSIALLWTGNVPFAYSYTFSKLVSGVGTLVTSHYKVLPVYTFEVEYLLAIISHSLRWVYTSKNFKLKVLGKFVRKVIEDYACF